jgi:hypothetical protein
MTRYINKSEITMEDETAERIFFELGDIVEIIAPSNLDIHEMTGYIYYIDETKMLVLNIDTKKRYQINVNSDGSLSDESITEFNLLKRSDEKGYARQHDLLPNTWIDIYFGGDTPVIITGEITNLEEDMIEITTYPDMDVIYIDFEYKGVPELIPIEKIIIREKPSSLRKLGSLSLEKEEGEPNYEALTKDELEELDEPVQNVLAELNDLYTDSDAIIFGENLEAITQLVEVPEGQRRYGIDTQVNDMMDELLSTIPTTQRTKMVLDNIHLLIQRYTQLRQTFSQYDENQNVYSPKIIGATHKPLVDRILHLDTKLHWLLPVATNRKHIYDEDVEMDTNDIINKKISKELIAIEALQSDAKMPYETINSSIFEILRPFDEAIPTNTILSTQKIGENMDMVLDNLNDFQSTVIKEGAVGKRKYVIQRYNLGFHNMKQFISKTGKKTYERHDMSPSDTVSLKSIIMLPLSVMKFSKINLPLTNIMEKTRLHQNYFMPFRLLNPKTDIVPYTIENLDTDFDYNKIEKEDKKTFLSGLMEFVLADDLAGSDEKYKNFLNVVVPKTRTLIRTIRQFIRGKLSFIHIVEYLEPFMIYTSDITYRQHDEIRYFIKGRIAELKKAYLQHSKEFDVIRNTKYNIVEVENPMFRLLSDKKAAYDMFMDTYGFSADNKPLGQESLSELLNTDNGKTLFCLLNILMLELNTPNSFMDVLVKPTIEDMTDLAKIKPTDSTKKVITKRYESVSALQKDNVNDEVYCDKEFDDTPYSIMDNYKEQQKKIPADEFMEYLSENLIQKHDISVEQSRDLAATLIRKKRLVKEGEYCILETRPKIPSGTDENTISASDKISMENEAEIRKKTQYYRRVKDNWVHDDSVDEESFIDIKSLYTNLASTMKQKTVTTATNNLDETALRMKEIAQRKMTGEFEKRYATTMEEIEDTLKKMVDKQVKLTRKVRLLNDIKAHKTNNLQYALGKLSSNDETLHSPHEKLRDLILGQEDFSKKQSDICQFFDKYCREPMVNELSEDAEWAYCKDTNTKLLPHFIYDLADVFVGGGDYAKKQAEICRKIGVLSDDGDSIVDKHSGYVIRKIDFATEEGYDDAGFRITTHDIMEKDAGTVLIEAYEKTQDGTMRIFENETSEIIYKIYSSICERIHIPIDATADFVMRTSSELMERAILSENTYNKRSEKMLKDKGKRLQPYKNYREELIIIIIAACTIISIQTAIPSFHLKKTFPGCVRSFTGYPLSGIEDTTCIQYIACVLDKMKAPINIWESIAKNNAKTLAKRIKEVIDEYVMKRADLTELFVKKREFLMLEPDADFIAEHSINKWIHFLPPVVKFSVIHSIKNIGSDFKNEFLEVLRKGHVKQDEMITIINSRAHEFGFAIIETMNNIIKDKDLLLKTSSSEPFLENACCNDGMTNPLQYFIKEDENIAIYIKNAENLGKTIAFYKSISRASMIYHVPYSGIRYPSISVGHLEENIYAVFIKYCNFDEDLPIPEAYKPICSEKPANYNKMWSLTEKMEFLKKNGKRYTVTDLYNITKLINEQNLVEVSSTPMVTPVMVLTDIIDTLDVTNSMVVEDKMRERLRKIIENFQPNAMVEESREVDDLRDYLYETNNKMMAEIIDFIDYYGNLSTTEYNGVVSFLQNLLEWNNSIDMHGNAKFIRNSVTSISSIYPNIIMNGGEHSTIPDHWALSDKDVIKLRTIIMKSYNSINEFKNDTILARLLLEITQNLVNLNIFTQNIPLHTPIHKNNASYFSLFDTKTIFALLNYCFLSVFYEYIDLSSDINMLRSDVQNFKKIRKDNIDNMANASNSMMGMATNITDELEDTMTNLEEVQINMGNETELKERVCKLLLAFIEIEEKNKKAINFSYDDIMKAVRRSREKEKQSIVKYLGNMTIEERQIEQDLKNYKLGKWNVGMQKGLVYYDQVTNERETDNLMAQLLEDVEAGDMDIATELMMEVYDVGKNVLQPTMAETEPTDRYGDGNDEGDFEATYDRNGFGIDTHLDEDYTDGIYYQEDRDEE